MSYCHKENVNILTSLLAAHGVRHAVVCPGSRNAPIVHNLNEHPDIVCHPVTDERSAGFYAVGMALELDSPVAVCVTSGTALLNLLPSVAEASERHAAVVVISADRPAQWIGQLDGQTMPQPDALGRFVRKAVSLPEPCDEEQRWYCNRLVNEALLYASSRGGGPVHINVPLSEPLFDFSVDALPSERVLRLAAKTPVDRQTVETLADRLLKARRPMVVIGQTACRSQSSPVFDMDVLRRRAVVLHEALAPIGYPVRIDETLLLMSGSDDQYQPDMVVYMGGTLVSKPLKAFLRRCSAPDVWMVGERDDVADVTMHATYLLEGSPLEVLRELCTTLSCRVSENTAYSSEAFVARWHSLMDRAALHAAEYVPAYSQMAAVRCFEQHLSVQSAGTVVHYANSMAVRLANVYATRGICCNRGMNGIEGSLSTAAGCSLIAAGNVFCVIGDLSFFYDSNALWNRELHGNLRILLLNNGGGGIFQRFEGLRQSAARESLVMGQHATSADGICQSYGVAYRAVRDMTALEAGMDWLTSAASNRPLLLEVFTDGEEDGRVLRDYQHVLVGNVRAIALK